jgi:hypothetical protein
MKKQASKEAGETIKGLKFGSFGNYSAINLLLILSEG